MIKSLNGYVLFSRTPILIRGYVVLLGATGIGVGVWSDSIMLMMAGAFLLGAHFSPILPIWKDVETDSDRRIVALRRASPEQQMTVYYWLLPIITLVMIGMAVYLKLSG